MNSKKLFTIYIVTGIMGAITTQALPIIYKSYGFNSNQIYNLISIVFLATIFQPIIGFVIDKYFSQKQGINILFIITGLISLGLTFITQYNVMLFTILIFSIFRVPMFAIIDGYVATLSHKFNLNMGLIRSGTMVGYGFGLLLLALFLSLFSLTANFAFLFMAILSLTVAVFLAFFTKEEKNIS